ncbi:MAG: hypothetical protein Q8907_01640 [Bacteroidota bacterium]|nr:hypothetical protein [Bacteroidota bacterium]
MAIEIKEVKGKKELKQFIYLPARIHKDHKNWVPPIYMDEWNFFNVKKNKFYNYCDSIFLLAYKDGEVVGRIMGLINRRYNEIHHENDGRFCFMETYEDPEVFHALIEYVEKWAREKGMDNIVGPLAFSDKDPEGFMVEGFDEPLCISTSCNFKYMPELLEKEGYGKKEDCVVYKIIVPEEIPDFYKAIYKRVMQKNGIQILNFEKRKDIRPYIKPILYLLNDTFKNIYAFVPFEEEEMDDFAKIYLPLLDPHFVKAIADNDGNLLAFIVGMPDLSKAIIAAKGKLLPFGIFKILRGRKTSKMLTLLLGGITEECRGKGIDSVLAIEMLKDAQKKGMKFIDSQLELESNTKIRMEMEKAGGRIYKRYRIFIKKL